MPWASILAPSSNAWVSDYPVQRYCSRAGNLSGRDAQQCKRVMREGVNDGI